MDTLIHTENVPEPNPAEQNQNTQPVNTGTPEPQVPQTPPENKPRRLKLGLMVGGTVLVLALAAYFLGAGDLFKGYIRGGMDKLDQYVQLIDKESTAENFDKIHTNDTLSFMVNTTDLVYVWLDDMQKTSREDNYDSPYGRLSVERAEQATPAEETPVTPVAGEMVLELKDLGFDSRVEKYKVVTEDDLVLVAKVNGESVELPKNYLVQGVSADHSFKLPNITYDEKAEGYPVGKLASNTYNFAIADKGGTKIKDIDVLVYEITPTVDPQRPKTGDDIDFGMQVMLKGEDKAEEENIYRIAVEKDREIMNPGWTTDQYVYIDGETAQVLEANDGHYKVYVVDQKNDLRQVGEIIDFYVGEPMITLSISGEEIVGSKEIHTGAGYFVNYDEYNVVGDSMKVQIDYAAYAERHPEVKELYLYGIFRDQEQQESGSFDAIIQETFDFDPSGIYEKTIENIMWGGPGIPGEYTFSVHENLRSVSPMQNSNGIIAKARRLVPDDLVLDADFINGGVPIGNGEFQFKDSSTIDERLPAERIQATWYFGDGTLSYVTDYSDPNYQPILGGRVTTHKFQEPGKYNVTLVITYKNVTGGDWKKDSVTKCASWVERDIFSVTVGECQEDVHFKPPRGEETTDPLDKPAPEVGRPDRPENPITTFIELEENPTIIPELVLNPELFIDVTPTEPAQEAPITASFEIERKVQALPNVLIFYDQTTLAEGLDSKNVANIWDFGDGSPAETTGFGEGATHIYPSQTGDYEATLTVLYLDNDNDKYYYGKATKTISVRIEGRTASNLLANIFHSSVDEMAFPGEYLTLNKGDKLILQAYDKAKEDVFHIRVGKQFQVDLDIIGEERNVIPPSSVSIDFTCQYDRAEEKLLLEAVTSPDTLTGWHWEMQKTTGGKSKKADGKTVSFDDVGTGEYGIDLTVDPVDKTSYKAIDVQTSCTQILACDAFPTYSEVKDVLTNALKNKKEIADSLKVIQTDKSDNYNSLSFCQKMASDIERYNAASAEATCNQDFVLVVNRQTISNGETYQNPVYKGNSEGVTTVVRPTHGKFEKGLYTPDSKFTGEDIILTEVKSEASREKGLLLTCIDVSNKPPIELEIPEEEEPVIEKPVIERPVRETPEDSEAPPSLNQPDMEDSEAPPSLSAPEMGDSETPPSLNTAPSGSTTSGSTTSGSTTGGSTTGGGGSGQTDFKETITRVVDPDKALSCWVEVEHPYDFDDVDENYYAKDVIDRLAEIGTEDGAIVVGYPKDRAPNERISRTAGANRIFGVYRNITREEFMKMVLFSSCISDADTDTSSAGYADMFRSFWSYEIINILSHLGVIHGYADNTVRPAENITRAEAAVVLLKMYELVDPDFEMVEFEAGKMMDVINNEYYSDVAATLFDLGIMRGSKDRDGNYYFDPKREITRVEAAVIINNYLSKLQELD